jgi:hypothetical protein
METISIFRQVDMGPVLYRAFLCKIVNNFFMKMFPDSMELIIFTYLIKTKKIMNAIEILMLENQIAMMQSIYEMSELSHSKMEELRKQIKKSKELLAFYKL